MRAFFLGRYDEGGWSEAWAGGQKGVNGTLSGVVLVNAFAAHK
jgi:hypothetical protein